MAVLQPQAPGLRAGTSSNPAQSFLAGLALRLRLRDLLWLLLRERLRLLLRLRERLLLRLLERERLRLRDLRARREGLGVSLGQLRSEVG